MADPKREELRVEKKKAILVAVLQPDPKADKQLALDELHGLVTTVGVRVVGTMVQFRERPHPATCLGRGKVDELRRMTQSLNAELVVFDNNLTPAQGRNLEEEIDTIIVDRSEVILDIFATRAQSYEAKLQVELAQLLYFRPRLKRLWTHLERIEGGVGTGRGPGEKQLETDRRLLERRVAELKRKLRAVEKRRKRTVATRTDQLTASLVGYTNAGKSTLMRALTGADVLIANKLFATLDTRTRRWQIPHCGEVLLSDTVGFVRDLPHHLVASFKSTLEEARNTDLLLHVVDAGHASAAEQIKTVWDVLDKIGVDKRNEILVLNKADAVQDRSILDVLRARYEDSVSISAVTQHGFDQLKRAVAERLAQGYVEANIETHVGNGRLFAYLAKHAEVISTEYRDSHVRFNCRMPRRFIGKLNGEGIVVKLLDAAPVHDIVTSGDERD